MTDISLSQYVQKRNGLPLGASGSMQNMLQRSLGADSFYTFWRYWNPIWGYYLSLKVMRPLSRFFPPWISIILTFAVSGGLHDLAVMLLKWKLVFFFTSWFVLMSCIVVLTKVSHFSLGQYPWIARVAANISIIVAILLLTVVIESHIA